MVPVASSDNPNSRAVEPQSTAYRDLSEQVMTIAQPRAGETAVDVGPGADPLALDLARLGVYVWAVDGRPRLAEAPRSARSDVGDIHAIAGSPLNLPLFAACADLVVLRSCVDDLTSAEIRTALSEAHRVLRPGGRLIIAGPAARAAVDEPPPAARPRLNRRIAGAFRRYRGASVKAQWWLEVLAATGFDDVHVECLSDGLVTGRKS